MRVDAFAEIRARVRIEDVFAMYSVTFNRAGFAPCPLHAEKRASLKVYPGKNTWHCFGCGKGTDAVDLVALMDRVSPIDAARRLSDKFGLRLFPDKPLTRIERRQVAEEIAERDADDEADKWFNDWLAAAAMEIGFTIRAMRKWRIIFAPANSDDELHPLFLIALHYLDFWQWVYRGVFVNGDFEDRMAFYKYFQDGRFSIRKIIDHATEIESNEREGYYRA